MSTKLPSVTSPPWSPSTKRVIVLVLLGLLILIGQQIGQSTWSRLLLTLVLAYLLSPMVTFFERRMGGIGSYDLRRALSVVMTWLFVLGILALIVGLIVPATVSQLRQFAEELPSLIESTQSDLEQTLRRPIRIGDFVIVPWDEINAIISPPNVQTEEETSEGDTLTNTLQSAMFSLADSALGVVGGAVSFMFSLFLLLVMLFYLMRDGPVFAEYTISAIPESYRGDALRLLRELGLIWNGYLRGQLLLNLSVGVATYIVALILGLPQPLLLALVAGFLELIPNIGPTLAAIPAVLFALTAPSTTIPSLDAGLVYAAVVGVAYTLIQQIESIFLVPRIMGGNLDLHPFVVLVAIVIAADIAGILGVILAAPSAATLRLGVRYLRGKLLDEELFPTLPPFTVPQGGIVYRLMHYFLTKRFPIMPPEGRPDRLLVEEKAVGDR